MVAGHTSERRIPPKHAAKAPRKYAIQLDFFDVFRDNVVITGANGAITPPAPNHSRGEVSAMIYPNTTPAATPSQVAPRPTYPQDWATYNLAQQHEKEQFLGLLRDLCSTVAQPPQTNGRPRLPPADMLFAAVYKVYSGFSSRRFTTDIQTAMGDGLIDHAPHFNTVSNYLSDPTLTPLLKSLISASASPLKAVESDFAIDSTGFSTSSYVRWFDFKWGKEKFRHLFVKTHLMVGVKTNIVTAVEATSNESADAPQLPALLGITAETFDVGEVSADKAYSSRRNIHAIDAIGGAAYIPFKTSAKGMSKKHKFDGMWYKAWHFYNYQRDAFAAHYHKRSNAETTMAMIKSKFGGSVKSKSAEAQVNEVLCKVLAHNICVLIQSFYELGIESIFCAEKAVAQEVPYLRLV